MFDFLKKETPNGPDFSKVTSLQEAEDLRAKGSWRSCCCCRRCSAAKDVPPDVVYVPAFVIDLKNGVDANVVRPLAQEGKITRYNAQPQYQGDSFIPCALRIKATDPGDFWTVGIWGDGLTKQSQNG